MYTTRINRLLCLALTAASVFMASPRAKAQLGPPITNNFENTFGVWGDDNYPGDPTEYGWSDIWKLSTPAAMTASVINTTPLNNSNNYLNIVIANTASKVAASRTYVQGEAVLWDPADFPNYDSFNVGYMPHKISFDFRVDYFATNGVPEDWTLDGSANDLAFISGMNAYGNSKPSSAAAWLIEVFGTSPSISTPSGPANTWLYFDGSANNASAAGAGRYVSSGMAFSFNTVYHFDVITDPRDKVYKVTVTDGVTTNISAWLHWSGFADPTQFSSENNITFGGGVNTATSSLSLSIDSILVQHLSPLEFPPRITQLSPYFWEPTPTNLASQLSFTPQLNPPAFYPAGKGLSFVASTAGGGSNDMQYVYNTGVDESTNVLTYQLAVDHTIIPFSGIGLVLNGANVSSGLNISGLPNYRHVSYNGLAPNTKYSGTIYVTNSAGAYTSRDIAFDTIDETSAIVIEAEDYNFGNGGYTRPGNTGTDSTVGGMFINNPPASDFTNGVYINQGSGYVDKDGATNVDYFQPNLPPDQFSSTLNIYRIADAISTIPANDYARTKYINSGARDFEVNNLTNGEWMNYTRTFPAGNYTPYLRAASTGTSGGGLNQVSLDVVTNDPTMMGQLTTNLGTFQVSYTGANGVFTNVGLGSSFFLSGTVTLRLTAGGHANGNNLWWNCLILVPDGTNLASVAITSPASGATFSSGANITLMAGASASGPISSVTYYNGTTSLGSSSSSPYAVTWNSVPTGKYNITAKAATAGGFTSVSAPVSITVGSPAKKVLFVVDAATESASLNAGDQLIANMIAANGWTTSLHYANLTAAANNLAAIGPEAANGFDLVVISANANSTPVANYFRDVPVPVFNCNQAEQGGRLALTKEIQASSGGVDYGITSGQNNVVVVATGDPGAAGYSGMQNLFLNVDIVNFGVPNANAIIIAKNTNDPAVSAYDYYYKAGAEMFDGVIAPAVRYQFFTGDAPALATNISVFGSNILSAGITVAAANPPFGMFPPYLLNPAIASGHITIPFTGLATDSPGRYKLYSSPNVTGPYVLDGSAVITGPVGTQFQAVTTAPPNPRYYFRILRQ